MSCMERFGNVGGRKFNDDLLATFGRVIGVFLAIPGTMAVFAFIFKDQRQDDPCKLGNFEEKGNSCAHSHGLFDKRRIRELGARFNVPSPAIR